MITTINVSSANVNLCIQFERISFEAATEAASDKPSYRFLCIEDLYIFFFGSVHLLPFDEEAIEAFRVQETVFKSTFKKGRMLTKILTCQCILFA